MTIRALAIAEDADRSTVETFAGLRRAGVEISVACPTPSAHRPRLADAGVRLLDLELRRAFDPSGVRMLRRELKAGRYDILHVLGNRALQNGVLAAAGLPVRLVAYRGIVGNVSFFDLVSWMRFLNPRVDRIVCVADAVRDHFLGMRPAFLRMPAERPVTIYKGHSLDWYTSEPADLASFSIPDGAFVVGCVANYRPRKGIELLVDAVAGLPEAWGVHLLLVGRMDSPRLTRHIAASGAAGRIHLAGYRADAPSVAAACDVFVLPSVRREGLARSLIEAMAYAVPPVVTDVGGSPELVVDGECGLVVPAGDCGALAAALRRLYEDGGLRRRLGEAARERIGRDFCIDDTIGRTLELYRELASEH